MRSRGYLGGRHARLGTSRVHMRPVVYVVFTEHVRGETISYARTTGEVGERRFSPARYYAGIDNAELVNAFSDQCAPFMDHTRKDLARTSTAALPPSFSQPLCAPRPKFEAAAVRQINSFESSRSRRRCASVARALAHEYNSAPRKKVETDRRS